MSQRKDHRHSSITETFGYDDLDRLTMSVINGDTVRVSYMDNGNIDSTSELGEYSYETAHPHAVTGISGGDSLKFPAQNISYTSFNMVDTLRQGDSSLVFTYGPDYGRKKTISTIDSIEITKYYSGGYEKIITPAGTRELHYIGAYGRLVALYEITDTAQTEMYYVHTDNLGSINCITNANDSIVQETSFSAWGKRRNPSTWVPLDTAPSNLITTRGYTGHEHIDEFSLINMNGRIYDPVLCRFISPDPLIANQSNTQDYNRYSYVLNNPLRYTDPSGYLKFSVAYWTTVCELGSGLTGGGGGGGSYSFRGGSLVPDIKSKAEKRHEYLVALKNAVNNFVARSGSSIDDIYSKMDDGGIATIDSEGNISMDNVYNYYGTEYDNGVFEDGSTTTSGKVDFSKTSDTEKIIHIMMSIREARQNKQESIDIRQIFSNFPKYGDGVNIGGNIKIGKNEISVHMAIAIYDDMKINIEPARIGQIAHPFSNVYVGGIIKNGYWDMMEFNRAGHNLSTLMIQTNTKGFDVFYDYLYK